MTLTLNDKYIKDFAENGALESISGEVKAAHAKLLERTSEKL